MILKNDNPTQLDRQSRDMTTHHHQIIIIILTTESYNYQSKMTWRELSVILNNVATHLNLFKGPKANKCPCCAYLC